MNPRSPCRIRSPAWSSMHRREFITGAASLAGAAVMPGQLWSAGTRREGFPPFSWDQVPVYRHLGPWAQPFTPAELDLLAKSSRFLTIERRPPDSPDDPAEESFFATARALKKRNPGMTLLMYWNAFILRSPWVKGYDPAWNLKDVRGQEIIKFGRVPRPDLSLPPVREWWSEVVARSLREAPFDGIFADALPQVLTPSLPKQVGPAKARQVVEGLATMLAMTRWKIGHTRIILANGLRASDYRTLLDWDSLSGLLIEHFGAFGSTSVQDLRADLESMRLAEAKGKFTVLKGWPGFSWLDAIANERPPGELLQLARERIVFPLACFLIGARAGCFFSYSWGYRENHGMLETYPEFAQALGPPRGDAIWQGDTATREFTHAAVAVDLGKKSGRIEWR